MTTQPVKNAVNETKNTATQLSPTSNIPPNNERVPPLHVKPQKAITPIGVSRGTRKRYMRPRVFSAPFGKAQRMTTMKRLNTKNKRTGIDIFVSFEVFLREGVSKLARPYDVLD